MSVSTQEFREAMSRLGSAVNVITTGNITTPHGFTASAVCSVTDTPPTLLVCLNSSARVRPAFIDGAGMCVNVLTSDQKELSGIFAGPYDMSQRFGSGDWSVLETGAPVLTNALASFDCQIDRIVEVGTHSVIFGLVKAIRLGTSGGGLMYFNRNYHDLPHSHGGDS